MIVRRCVCEVVGGCGGSLLGGLCAEGLMGVYGELFGFFFQAEDGIRDAQESRGLGDVYKRQP